MKLTKERALELHRKMWSDMRTVLGDCPDYHERLAFKRNWILNHKKDIPEIKDSFCIINHCFLCKFVEQEHPHSVGTYECEYLCPINWSKLTNKLRRFSFSGRHKGYPNTCMFGSYKNGYWEIWQTESITDILNLPERDI